MEFQYEKERIFACDEAGKVIAEITFPVSQGVADINHTFVDGSLRGQGVAGKADGGRGGLHPCAGAASAHQLLVCGQVAVGAPGALGAARIKCRKKQACGTFCQAAQARKRGRVPLFQRGKGAGAF